MLKQFEYQNKETVLDYNPKSEIHIQCDIYINTRLNKLINEDGKVKNLP